MRARPPARCISLVAAVLLALVACSGLRVQTDYDDTYVFVGRTSYAWLEEPLTEAPASSSEDPKPFARNSLLDERIRHAVDRSLASKGLRISLEDPAYRIQYYVVLEDRLRIRPAHGGYYGGRYGYYGGYGGYGSYSYEYREGTLIIDFIDARTGRIAWRGWAVGPNRDGYYTEERVDESVDKILDRFPAVRAE